MSRALFAGAQPERVKVIGNFLTLLNCPGFSGGIVV
jgi:hypothetical protein